MRLIPPRDQRRRRSLRALQHRGRVLSVRYMAALVRGPGNIAQPHPVGEWIAAEQLHEAVETVHAI